MAFMCELGHGECDGCGACRDWDEDENEAFRDDEYRPEDDWEEEE